MSDIDLYVRIDDDLYFNTDKDEILPEIIKAERLSKIYKAKAKFYNCLLSASTARNEYLRLRKEMDESEAIMS